MTPSKPSDLRPSRPECKGGPRPCPLVGCRYNTYLNISRHGHIQISVPHRQPESVPPDESCSLDLADEGSQTLERVGEVLGLTRERVRQIEVDALNKLRYVLGEDVLDEWYKNLRMQSLGQRLSPDT